MIRDGLRMGIFGVVVSKIAHFLALFLFVLLNNSAAWNVDMRQVGSPMGRRWWRRT